MCNDSDFLAQLCDIMRKATFQPASDNHLVFLVYCFRAAPFTHSSCTPHKGHTRVIQGSYNDNENNLR